MRSSNSRSGPPLTGSFSATRLVLLATVAIIASTPAAAQKTGVIRQAVVVGGDDRVVVAKDGLNVEEKYRPFLDAIGYVWPSGCTATHIGNGVVVSAGHCFSGTKVTRFNTRCDGKSVYWGYRADSIITRSGFTPILGATHYLMSRCVRMLALKDQDPYDYAIFEVDSIPTAFVPVTADAGYSSGVSTPGTVFGHPQHKSLRWSGTCYLPPYGTGFSHGCDTEPGNSGSLVIEANHLRGVGINFANSGVRNLGIYFGSTPLRQIIEERFTPHHSIVGLGGRCLDVAGSTSADRTPLQLFECNGTAAQKWVITPNQTLVGLGFKCLDTPTDADRTRTWLFTCHGAENQLWHLSDANLHGLGGKCLDVPGVKPANTTRAQIWECHGGDGQKWVVTARHEIRNTQGRCLDASGSNTANGTAVILFDCSGGANQKWDFMRDGHVRGMGGKCLDVTGASANNGTALQLYDCHESAAQRWEIRGLIRGLGGKCLDASGPATNGTPIVVFECHGGPNQRWTYRP